MSHRLRLSLDGEVEGDRHPPRILLFIVDHGRGLGRGGDVEHEEDGGMARSGGLGTLGLELLARQARDRPVLGGGQEERIVAERADPQVIAVHRLESVPHRVDALGDGLVAIIVALAEELHDPEQFALARGRGTG